MPKNEEGEFELILGNKQLLSVFFIVIVLLGVFFTMGYIVGRNTGPLPPAEVAARKESKPLVVESAAPGAVAKPVSTTEPKAESEAAVSAPAKRELTPVKAEATKPAPAKAESPKPPKETAPDPASGGVYLQLTATTQHEAEVYVDVLKKKGFKAITSAVPDKPGLIRVMVGPLAENAVGKTRSDLNAAGFPGDKAFKRSL